MDGAVRSLIFTYGTLKRGFANHGLMQDLIEHNDAEFIGSYVTRAPHPLVLGPQGIPYLIHLPGSGHPVKGELYGVTPRGVARLDRLEGTSFGHYERRPLQVEAEGSIDAEAYFAHRGFGERLWEKRGKVGLNDYGEKEAKEYVRIENRPRDSSFLTDMEAFLSSN